MAGSVESDSEELQRNECSFVWDEATQLYFHASSGFYHDPNAGWYYSSRDGLYYKFENGNYIPLESDKISEHEMLLCGGTAPDNPVQHEPCTNVYSNSNENYSAIQGDESGAYKCLGTVLEEPTPGHTERTSNQAPENPPPPSEWLEDTLINLYLSGYNLSINAADDATTALETKDSYNFELSADGNGDTHELEEGEWIPEGDCDLTYSNERVLEEGTSWDEENWQAQYGQVIESREEPVPEFPVVDLWDWAMVTGSRKYGKGQVVRLVGRLVRRSAKLHPSMPSGGLLKTAPISEVRLDLVRVTTGQVYKLRSPSAKYLASLSTYDSSNPTKDWGFPELSIYRQISPLSKSSQSSNSKTADWVADCEDLFTLPDQLSASKKYKSCAYRDRAAERRNLHGGFGVGPGQKSAMVGDVGNPLASVSPCTEDAAAEALNMSFGAGSYARKILESMGWKEGEALGNTTKGLVEPIQAVGNIGNAGLGWPQGRTKHH